MEAQLVADHAISAAGWLWTHSIRKQGFQSLGYRNHPLCTLSAFAVLFFQIYNSHIHKALAIWMCSFVIRFAQSTVTARGAAGPFAVLCFRVSSLCSFSQPSGTLPTKALPSTRLFLASWCSQGGEQRIVHEQENRSLLSAAARCLLLLPFPEHLPAPEEGKSPQHPLCTMSSQEGIVGMSPLLPLGVTSCSGSVPHCCPLGLCIRDCSSDSCDAISWDIPSIMSGPLLVQ